MFSEANMHSFKNNLYRFHTYHNLAIIRLVLQPTHRIPLQDFHSKFHVELLTYI